MFMACCATASLLAADQSIVGWQSLRVMEQVGAPDFMRIIDVDGDGRQELL